MLARISAEEGDPPTLVELINLRSDDSFCQKATKRFGRGKIDVSLNKDSVTTP